jgi:hypothetical protein
MTTKFGEHCGTFSQTKSEFIHRSDIGDNTNITDSVGGTFRQSTFSGTELPNWKSLIRQGGNATTPMIGVRYSQDVAFGSDVVEWVPVDPSSTFITRGKDEFFGYGSNTMSPDYSADAPGDIKTKVDNRALSKFISACNSARSSVEAGQDFGELKQTLEGIINPMGSLRRHTLGYFDKLMKVRRSTKRVNLPKALADTYLEWTFGWKPLAQDVGDAIAGLGNRKNTMSLVPVKGHAHDSYDGQTEAYTHSSTSVFIHNGFVKSTSQYSVRYKGMVRTGAENGTIGVDQVLQLDLPHFLPTAWDLLPYSFIVDYFANIGDIVSAFSFCTSNLAWVCKTTRQESIREYAPSGQLKFQSPLLHKITSQRAATDRSRFKKTTVGRNGPLVTDLIPSLQFSLPLSDKPWINMGAIMTSRSKSLRPFF